jgi:hypothetical protein
MKGTDLSRMDESIVATYDDTPATGGIRVFTPETVGAK